jgi:hypothetical protein
MMKVAVFHDGTLDGDNAFYAPNDYVEYNGESFAALVDKFYAKKLEEDEGLSCEEMKDMWDPKGAWIITVEQRDLINFVWESDPGNDGAVYMCNHIAKSMCNAACELHLGEEAK